MKTIVCGSRKSESYLREAVFQYLEQCPWEITELVSGKATGVDLFAEQWAAKRKVPIRPFPALWRPSKHSSKVDRSAGPRRNALMAEYAEACIAFPGGVGTADMLNKAKRAGLRIWEPMQE